MKNIRPLAATLLAVLTVACTSLANANAEESKEVTTEQRNAAAKTKLDDTPDTLSVYVKDMCCPSCAKSIRKHVGKLNFIDKKRLTDGIDIDTGYQLVLLAVKDGKTADLEKLAQAVDDAGYQPMELYRLAGENLETTPLEVPED